MAGADITLQNNKKTKKLYPRTFLRNVYMDDGVTALPSILSGITTNSATSIQVSMDESNYVATINLLNEKGMIISTASLDLPLESMLVDCDYRDGKLVMMLQTGKIVEVEINEMVTGLVHESRMINGKSLITDIELDAHDVGALPADTQYVSSINGESGALDDIAKLEDLPTKISELENDLNLVTESQVSEMLANADVSIDLSDYSKVGHTHTEYAPFTHTHTDMATQTFVKDEISKIPTPDVSGQIQQHNDSSDAHQDIRDVISDIVNKSDIAIASSNTKYAISTSDKEISLVNEYLSKTSNSTVRMRGCAYGNGIYVITGTSGAVQYSTDRGQTWTIISAFTSNVIVSVAYGGGYFICVDSAGGIFKSADCISWTQLSSPTSDIINSIMYINGKFALVGANGLIAFSNDGEKFTLMNSGVTNELTSITRGLDKYVAVSTAGDILISINGIDWENRSVDTTHYRTATFGKNIFVIGGASGKIKYSTDAVNWIDATNDSTSTVNYIRDIKYANGKFYAVMYISTGQGEIWTSLDGATWTKVQTTAARLWCLGYGNDIFFASGDSGAIWVLDQNISWVDTQPTTNGENYIWSKETYYLTDGSIVEGEVEVYPAFTDLENKIPTNYLTNSDLANYLPLTAGSDKKITGDLYLSKTIIIPNNKAYKSIDSNGEAKELLRLGTSNTLILGDSGSNFEIGVYGNLRPVSGKTANLGTANNPWNNIRGTTIYQNGVKVADIDGTGCALEIVKDETTYTYTLNLKNSSGVILSTQTLDLPIESLVVNGSYSNGILTLTLKNSQTIPIDISDIVSGLVPTSRTINSKPLTSNITLSASDVGALPDTTTYVSSIDGKTGALTGIAKTSDLPTITLNGSATTTPSFYAPTGAGTSNYILKSNGSGAPTWLAQSSIAAGSANKLATSRTINGTSFNGESNIVTDYSYNITFDRKTDTANYYAIFASIDSSYMSSNYGATLLVAGATNSGQKASGSYMVSIVGRKGDPTMGVVEIIGGGSSYEFGYYLSGTTYYFGVKCVSSRAKLNITVLNKDQVTTGNLSDTATAPSGWTAVTPSKFLSTTGGTLTGTVTMTGGDFLARYVGVSAAGHETSTYDKVAILSNTDNGYIRYRTLAEMKSDLGVPTVNNGTLTIQKNSTSAGTFTANQSGNSTINLTFGAAADKSVDTSISASSTSENLPTSKAVATFVEGKGYTTATGHNHNSNYQAKGTIDITDTTPTSATKYYPIYSTGTGTEQTARANSDLYYYDSGTWSSLNVGTKDHKGILTLHWGNSSTDYYVDIAPGSALTGNRTLTIPDKSGTIALTSDLIKLETANGRITNANVAHTYENSKAHLQLLQASSTMTSNKPASDGYIMHFSWDNNGEHNSQIFIPNNEASGVPQYRIAKEGSWANSSGWHNFITDTNISSQSVASATKATNDGNGNAITSTYFKKSGGDISGHVYLTGSNATSSTGNTSQLVFGTSSSQHVAVSSNSKALVINPTTSTTTNQIVLYLDKQSQFPSGIKSGAVVTIGNANLSYDSTNKCLKFTFS